MPKQKVMWWQFYVPLLTNLCDMMSAVPSEDQRNIQAEIRPLLACFPDVSSSNCEWSLPAPLRIVLPSSLGPISLLNSYAGYWPVICCETPLTGKNLLPFSCPRYHFTFAVWSWSWVRELKSHESCTFGGSSSEMLSLELVFFGRVLIWLLTKKV